jgi:hypothetical protein
MIEETLHHRGTTLVRRLYFEPGEAMRWNVDPFHRVSVVLRGEALMIEFRDTGTFSKLLKSRSTKSDPSESSTPVNFRKARLYGPFA